MAATTKSARSAARGKRGYPVTIAKPKGGQSAGRAKGSVAGLTSFDRAVAGDSIGSAYETFLQAADLILSGLPIGALAQLQRTSGFALERIKQVARISDGSLARRKATGRLSADESERLMRVARLFEGATSLFNGDQAGAAEWLETPRPALGNRRPLDLAQTELGAREVEDLMGRISHGVVS